MTDDLARRPHLGDSLDGAGDRCLAHVEHAEPVEHEGVVAVEHVGEGGHPERLFGIAAPLGQARAQFLIAVEDRVGVGEKVHHTEA